MAGMILELAKVAELEVVVSVGPNQATWDSVLPLAKAIKGAYIASAQTSLVPLDSVPKAYELGFEFFLYWAFEKKYPNLKHMDFTKVKHIGSILPDGAAGWGSKASLPLVFKLEGLIRAAAAKCANKIGPTKAFVKSLQELQGKIVGKKPVMGIYTNEEFSLLSKDWEDRMTHIEKEYNSHFGNDSKSDASASSSSSSSSSSSASKGNNPGVFAETMLQGILSQLSVKPVKIVKEVEENAKRRIPYLLEVVGKGRQAKQSIVKGGTLQQKILNKGFEQTRVPAILMWSPLSGITEAAFVGAVQNVVYKKYSKAGCNTADEVKDFVASMATPPKDLEVLATNILGAVELYVEIINVSSDNSSFVRQFCR